MTGAIYREPGLLAKILSTLDVLSGGRAMLGIGAAWNEEESTGLGFRFPPVTERFERLEETLQICLQMWSGDESPYEGRHYRLARTLNSPQPLRTPPILIGGGGEKKTLRLVARYAQACNLFPMPVPELQRKLDVLREHCAAEGRDYDEIRKTVYYGFDLSQGPQKVLDDLAPLAELGFTLALGYVAGAHELTPLETLAADVMPHL